MGNMCMTPIERIHYEYHANLDKEKHEQYIREMKELHDRSESKEKQFQTWLKSENALTIKTELTKDLQKTVQRQFPTVEFSPVVYELTKSVPDEHISYLLNGPDGPYVIKIYTDSHTSRRFIKLNDKKYGNQFRFIGPNDD